MSLSGLANGLRARDTVREVRWCLPALLLGVFACTGEEPGPPLDGYEWTFSEDVTVPTQRGLGGSEHVCAPVTADTNTVEVSVAFEPSPAFEAGSRIRFLVFEYDPTIADASALCVGGGVFAVDASPVSRSFEVPADRSDLRYYVTVSADIDGNGSLDDACTDYTAMDFYGISADRVAVTIQPFGCD
jgi:hypothetical protein